MNLNTADALQAFIESIKAKTIEEIVDLIKSDAVTKDNDGFIRMYDSELVKLILESDANKAKKKIAALKDEGEIEAEISFDVIRDLD